jgi:transcriptional regulator with XRE-family HTH domain
MKKTLKEHRTLKQLSQQELSDESGISIRTIQRIEKNLSIGSPHVIKSLCSALKIDIADLEIPKLNQENQKDEDTEIIDDDISVVNNDQKLIKRINLSAITVVLFPLLNLIIPILLYWSYKKSLQNNTPALKILTFQVLWTLLTFLVLLLTKSFIYMELGGYPFFIWLYFISVICNLIVVFDTAIKLNKTLEILPFVPKPL